MRALLLTVVILFGAIGSVVAQKKNTLIGDLVIGELTGIDEATREITLDMEKRLKAMPGNPKK